jgi:hypothetical protein
MPRPEQLPDALRRLSFQNAVVVRQDPDFRLDVKRLVASVNSASQYSPREYQRLTRLRTKLVRAISALIAIGVLAVVGAFYFGAYRSAARVSDPAKSVMYTSEVVKMPVAVASQNVQMTTTVIQFNFQSLSRTVTKKVPGANGAMKDVWSDEPYTAVRHVSEVLQNVVPNNAVVKVYKPLVSDMPYIITFTIDDPSQSQSFTSTTPPEFSVHDTTPAAPAKAMPMPAPKKSN